MMLSCTALRPKMTILKEKRIDNGLTDVNRERLEQAESKCEEGKEKLEEGRRVFEIDKDFTYFAENYLVHHLCKLCSGYANII